MIIVFGSINLDITVPVERMPAPGETLLGGDCIMSPGGKGANQAHAARLAGAEVAMVGRVGGDGFAAPALARLEAAGVDLTRVGRSPRPTGCATIWVAPDGESTIVVSPGANLDAAADDLDDATLSRAKLLLLQHEVPLAENARLIARARRAGLRIVLNAAPAMPVPADVLEAIDDLVVNEIEIRQIAAAAGLDTEPADTLPGRVAKRLGAAVTATYGAAGLVHHDGVSETRLEACRIEPVDTTAAGDTFVGVFCACLGRGMAENEALELANRAAALCCTRHGAQAAQPRLEAIRDFPCQGRVG